MTSGARASLTFRGGLRERTSFRSSTIALKPLPPRAGRTTRCSGPAAQMTLPIEAAVRSLARSAEARAGDAKLEGRLTALQSLLVDDLTWVERALAEATSRGERPGRDAARHLVVNAGKRIRP